MLCVVSPQELLELVPERSVAVVLTSISDDQRHLKIAHKCDADSIKLLHLAWHQDLRNDDAEPGGIWVVPDIPKARAVQVAARCREIWRANEKEGVPYAFSYPNDCFDAETGRFLIGQSTLGLTCATFVVAVFQAAGYKVIDFHSWPSREEDLEWQRKILHLLRQHSANRAHIEELRAECGATRVRPEEVAGASGSRPWPVEFERARKVADRLLLKLAGSP